MGSTIRVSITPPPLNSEACGREIAAQWPGEANCAICSDPQAALLGVRCGLEYGQAADLLARCGEKNEKSAVRWCKSLGQAHGRWKREEERAKSKEAIFRSELQGSAGRGEVGPGVASPRLSTELDQGSRIKDDRTARSCPTPLLTGLCFFFPLPPHATIDIQHRTQLTTSQKRASDLFVFRPPPAISGPTAVNPSRFLRRRTKRTAHHHFLIPASCHLRLLHGTICGMPRWLLPPESEFSPHVRR